MKLPGFLNKPRWQSKDAAMRLVAVNNDNEPELVAALGRLAREDADPGVRLAAMKRCADAGIVQAMLQDDADASVRKQARSLWFDLLAGTHPAAPAAAVRVRLLKAQDDPELIEHVARRASDAEIRATALARSTRPALFVERALEDPDASIRMAALERIADEAQLLRLAERARKTDKLIARRARERVDALRIERGDGSTLEQRARLLCERLEQLVRDPQPDVEADIATRWNAIESEVAPGFRQRYAAAQQHLLAARSPRIAEPLIEELPVAPADVDMLQPIETSLIDPEEAGYAADAPEAQPEPVIEALVAPLLAQARFAGELDTANAAQQHEQQRQRAVHEEIEAALPAFEQAVEGGNSAAAHAAKAKLDGLRRSIDTALPAAIARRLNVAEADYAKLSQWQHWADNQRRLQLCDEIEALPAAGLHPDAVASRIRDAQAEWNKLDAAEGRQSAKPSGLARRFHAASRAALAPAQAYFSKRQELRKTQGQHVSDLLDRAAAIPWDSEDHAAIVAVRREVVEALRGLDSVDPRERKALAQRAKTQLTALDARIEQRDHRIEQAKAVLIAEAVVLGQPNPPRGAAASARELQQRWQAIGNGRRSRDQAQWKTFRAALDAVFGALDAERAERGARDAEARGQAEELCADLERLADDTAGADRGAVSRIETAFESMRVRDDVVLQRFRAAQSRLREAATQRQRGERHARFEHWLLRYRICRDAESGSMDGAQCRAQWDQAPRTDIATVILERRFQSALDGTTTAADDAAAFRDVLIELDYLAGVEASEEDRERRRKFQLEKLSARMRGGVVTAPQDELAHLLTRWTDLGAAPDTSWDARIESGLRAALTALG